MPPSRAADFSCFARQAACWLLAAVLFPPAASAHGALRFDNGRWYDGETFRELTFYSVDGVLAAQHDGPLDRVVDLGGKWIVPPFGDAHSHALADQRFARDQASFLARGIYYVANPNSVLAGTEAARSEAAKPETVDVVYATGGLTSTGGHPAQIYERDTAQPVLEGQAYYAIDTPAALDSQWPRILAGRPDFLKVYLEQAEHHAARRVDPAWYGRRGLDPALLPEVVERAHRAGLRVSAHVSSAFDFALAVDAGVDEIAHLPLERLAPAAATRAASRGTVVVTTVTSHRPAPGVPDLEAVHRHNLELLRRSGVTLVLGTDGERSVLDEADAVASLAGLTAAERLRLLTITTPRWIFPKRRIGLFEPGHEASFLVLEANPLEDPNALRRIGLRVKSGHVLEPAAGAGLPAVADPLGAIVMHRGVDAAIAEYRRLRRDEASDWDFSERQLNDLGYALLRHRRHRDAIAIFLLNAQQFPASSNVWDSLGEGYLLDGQRDRAVASYQRALALDPGNDNARAKLAELEVP